MQTRDWLFIAVLLWGGWHALAGALPFTIPSIVAPATKVTHVSYIFEKDDTAVPSAVSSALNTLNRRDIIATQWDDDVTNGQGQIPPRHKVALEAARTIGLPALVVMNDMEVVRVVKAPTTDTQVFEAAK